MLFGHRINRRNDIRVAVRCEVRLQSPLDPEAVREGQVHDLSVAGMQLLTDWPPDWPCEPDSKILLSFECRELGWPPIQSCMASVMWIDPHPVQGQRRLGVKFDEPGV